MLVLGCFGDVLFVLLDVIFEKCVWAEAFDLKTPAVYICFQCHKKNTSRLKDSSHKFKVDHEKERNSYLWIV